MNEQDIKIKIKSQAKQIGWRIITTVVLTLTAIVTVWAYAAFIEPSVGPNSSDQDFSQNILGNNDANNDFDSSNVVANPNGSIIERLESVQERTCGNGITEIGEACDDGGTSWTSGTCAGDCLKQNYWSNPLVGEMNIYTTSVNRWCQEHNFNNIASSNLSTSIFTTSTWSIAYTECSYFNYQTHTKTVVLGAGYDIYSGAKEGMLYVLGIWTNSQAAAKTNSVWNTTNISTYTAFYGSTTCGVITVSKYTVTDSSQLAYIGEIWCAD